MRIYYEPGTGNVFYAVYDVDLFRFQHTTHFPLETLDLDEMAPVNQENCALLYRWARQRDCDGVHRFYVSEGKIFERKDWEPCDVQPTN